MVNSAGRVLLVEDDAIVAEGYSKHLQRSGFCVDIAWSGQQAISLLQHKNGTPFDVIVSDIRLPDINGMVILEQVRGFNSDIPFIFTTAYPSLESAIAGINHGGIYGYLVKPVDPNTLIRKVQRAVQLHILQRLSQQAAAVSSTSVIAPQDELNAEFEHALQTLWMAYQPIVSARTRQVRAYEALVRNNSQTLRSPPDLMDAARALGRLHELGRTIRHAVARDVEAAGPSLRDDVMLFININPDDLNDPMLTSVCDEPLLAYSDRVVFEVTERSSLHSVANLEQARRELNQLGYRIAVDDLGQGHAGLNSLVQLDPEFVKLDMVLVRDIHKDVRRQQIVGAMFQLCRNSNMGVVAEGIETEEEYETLLRLGADLLQGYLFARPQPGFIEPDIS